MYEFSTLAQEIERRHLGLPPAFRWCEICGCFPTSLVARTPDMNDDVPLDGWSEEDETDEPDNDDED